MVLSKPRRIPLPTQGELLCRLMPGTHFVLKQDVLYWWGWITPSLTSLSYKVRIITRVGRRPAVHILSPKLIVPDGQTLPHSYNGRELCLYFPDGKEWHEGKLIAHTILPWISEWLYHYEIWSVTGQWNGGGKH